MKTIISFTGAIATIATIVLLGGAIAPDLHSAETPPAPTMKTNIPAWTGRSLDSKEAVAQADWVFVGLLTSAGVISPGAPGQSYHENAKVKVSRLFKGEPMPEATLSFTVQKIPKGHEEQTPARGSNYVFFVKGPKTQLRAMKLLPATPEEVKRVIELLPATPARP